MTQVFEKSRSYSYPDGYVYEIIEPVDAVALVDHNAPWATSSQTITDSQGTIHTVQPGWRVLRIKPLKGVK